MTERDGIQLAPGDVGEVKFVVRVRITRRGPLRVVTHSEGATVVATVKVPACH
jgi:archaellum component FlaG (FlaF/FlaG flagellin family)